MWPVLEGVWLVASLHVMTLTMLSRPGSDLLNTLWDRQKHDTCKREALSSTYLVFSVRLTGTAGGGMSMGLEEDGATCGRGDTGRGAAVFASLLGTSRLDNKGRF